MPSCEHAKVATALSLSYCVATDVTRLNLDEAQHQDVSIHKCLSRSANSLIVSDNPKYNREWQRFGAVAGEPAVRITSAQSSQR